jgi:hypothetical protein
MCRIKNGSSKNVQKVKLTSSTKRKDNILQVGWECESKVGVFKNYLIMGESLNKKQKRLWLTDRRTKMHRILLGAQAD